MNWLSIIIFVWLALSFWSGLKTGFVYKAGTVIGFIAGLWFASRWTPGIAYFFGGGPITIAVVFLIILSLLSKLFGLGAWTLDKVFKILTIIPFLKTFNRIFGGMLSILISCFIISTGLFIVNSMATVAGAKNITTIIEKSTIAASLLELKGVYKPLLSNTLSEYLDEAS